MKPLFPSVHSKERKVREIVNDYKPKQGVSEVSLKNLVTEKPKWINLPTKAIRIPEIFANRLLSIARHWDNQSQETIDTQINSENIEEAIVILRNSLNMKANNGSAIKREIRKALELLNQQNQ